MRFPATVSTLSLTVAIGASLLVPIASSAQTTPIPATGGVPAKSAVAEDKEKITADKAAIEKDKANLKADKAKLKEDEKKERQDEMKERQKKK